MPAHGVLNLVTGAPEPIGAALTADPRVRKLSFTGSTEVGRLLMRQCADTLKRVSLECGGNAPFIVFDDADLDAAVEGAVQSKYRNAGQTCVCANRLLVQSGVHDAFARRLAERVADLPVGPGTQTDVAQGPLIDTDALAKVEAHISDALEHGARLLTGGHRHALGGTFFQPTVITGVTPAMRITREETFGPVAPALRFAPSTCVSRFDRGPIGRGHTRGLVANTIGSWMRPESTGLLVSRPALGSHLGAAPGLLSAIGPTAACQVGTTFASIAMVGLSGDHYGAGNKVYRPLY